LAKLPLLVGCGLIERGDPKIENGAFHVQIPRCHWAETYHNDVG
jgi:hypothetical protein